MRWPQPAAGGFGPPQWASDADLLTDRSASEDYDADAVGQRGVGFVRLNQLTVEHLTGVR